MYLFENEAYSQRLPHVGTFWNLLRVRAIDDDGLTKCFFPLLETEYKRAADLATTVGDRDDLVNCDWLHEGLRRQDPYVDPLNVLQTHLLDHEHRTQTEKQALHLTVKEITARMKTPGREDIFLFEPPSVFQMNIR